jgi:hypothetical protein
MSICIVRYGSSICARDGLVWIDVTADDEQQQIRSTATETRTSARRRAAMLTSKPELRLELKLESDLELEVEVDVEGDIDIDAEIEAEIEADDGVSATVVVIGDDNVLLDATGGREDAEHRCNTTSPILGMRREMMLYLKHVFSFS